MNKSVKKRILAVILLLSLTFILSACQKPVHNVQYLQDIQLDDFEEILTLNGVRYYSHDPLICTDINVLTKIGTARFNLVGNEKATSHSVYVYPDIQDPLFVYCEDIGVFTDHDLYNPADDFTGFNKYSGMTVVSVYADDSDNKDITKAEYSFKSPLSFNELFSGKVMEFSTISKSSDYVEEQHYEIDFIFSDDVPLAKRCKSYKIDGKYYVGYFDFWDGYAISGVDDNMYYELRKSLLKK